MFRVRAPRRRLHGGGSAEKALRRRLQLATGEIEAASRVRENEWER